MVYICQSQLLTFSVGSLRSCLLLAWLYNLNSNSMSSHPGAVIVEIDLKKKKLQEEIIQLERELHRQEKKHQKEEQAIRKDRSRISVKSKEEKPAGRHHREHKDSKPAINQAWKQLFSRDPHLHRPDSTLYFDKQQYRVKSGYVTNQKGIFGLLSSEVMSDCDYIF